MSSRVPRALAPHHNGTRSRAAPCRARLAPEMMIAAGMSPRPGAFGEDEPRDDRLRDRLRNRRRFVVARRCARRRRRHRAQRPLAGQEIRQATYSSTCAREKVSRGPGKRKFRLECRPQSGRSARVDIEGARAAGPQRSQRPVRVTIRAPSEWHRAGDAERAKADLPTMSMSPARVCNVRRQ